MPKFSSDSGTLYFEQHGSRANPPVLLIHGLGCQIVHWPNSFIDGIVNAGFRVITLDNRDAGLSFSVDVEPASIEQIIIAQKNPSSLKSPYTLTDMATDAVALLDHLGQAGAHVVGMSMGGMIAQRMAIHHPSRIFTLTSMMSSTGDPRLPMPKEETIGALLTSAVIDDEKSVIRNIITSCNHLGGPHYDSETVGLGRFAQSSYDRAYRPNGFVRQLTAIVTDEERTKALRTVVAPALVIHGNADPLFPIAAGEATSEAMPQAKLQIIEKLGHDLPEPVIPSLVDSITRLAQRAEIER